LWLEVSTAKGEGNAKAALRQGIPRLDSLFARSAAFVLSPGGEVYSRPLSRGDSSPDNGKVLVGNSETADSHELTEKSLWKRIFQSPAIHVDETKLGILGTYQQVWVITNGTEVSFHLTDTRETGFLQKLLNGYQGVLVTDFYGGYDAIACRQQKCLAHLIRDLNDDLWKNPFYLEYEQFVASVRDVLMPIFEDVERCGLKTRHLRKHRRHVEDLGFLLSGLKDVDLYESKQGKRTSREA
jgi:hypothetical protein